MDSEYRRLVLECSEQAKSLARMLANKGQIEPLYLYYRESQPGKPGKLLMARDSAPNPEGLKLVTGEGLRGGVPFDKYFQWIYERARNAPILSIDKEEVPETSSAPVPRGG